MAKLEDYLACDIRHTNEGNYAFVDEDNAIPCIYEDSDEYIIKYWGDYQYIGKFSATFKGKEVQVLVFKDFEEYFGVFKK